MRSSSQFYNRRTDVLDISLNEADETITVDTPEGFVVHYSLPERQPVGITVWDYCLRFGADQKTLRIDVVPPIEVKVDAVECTATWAAAH